MVFHENVAIDSQSLKTELKEKSHCGMGKIEFLSKKGRVNNDEVGEVVAFNDVARQILRSAAADRVATAEYLQRIQDVKCKRLGKD